MHTKPHKDILCWQFSAEQLRDPELVSRLVQRIAVACDLRRGNTCLQLVVVEILNNALDHGVLRLESAIKEEVNGFTRYYKERERRLAELTSGWIEVSIEIIAGKTLCLRVLDSGDGFDYRSSRRDAQATMHSLATTGSGDAGPAGQSVPEQQAYGRGLTILDELCDTLVHVGCGNEIVVEIDLDTLSKPPKYRGEDSIVGTESA